MIFYPSSLARGTERAGRERADRTLKTIQRRETRKKRGTAREPRTHSVSRTAHGTDSEDSKEFRCGSGTERDRGAFEGLNTRV